MAEPLSESSRPRLARNARLRYEEVRKADLLLLPERVVKLNPTGAAILRLCDGNHTVRDIATELETRYGQQNLEKDVLDFLRQVTAQGWVK